MRQATYRDVGRLAYGVMVWDQELPEFLRTIKGDAELAHRAAEIMVSPKFVTWVIEEDGDIVAAITIEQNVSLYGFCFYGNVAGVYVLPKYRGQRMLGLRLLNKAKELKQTLGWSWLFVNPWADDTNTERVLERLGFEESIHTYMLR